MAEKDFSCLATIHKIQETQNTASIQDTFSMEVQYDVPYGERDLETLNKARIPTHREFASTAYIDWTNVKFPSKGFVAYESFFASTAKINETFAMDVTYRYVQPPLQYLKLYPNQDAYIRQYRPTINYGSNQTLVVGSAIEGNFRTFIQLDINAYANLREVIVKRVDFKFSLASNYNPDIIFDVHEVSDTWYENGVTWAKGIKYNPVPAFSFQCTGSQMRIDLRTYLDELITKGKRSLNLMFKMRDEDVESLLYLNSREVVDVTARPQLDIVYFDKEWVGFVEETDMHLQATIRRTKNFDLYSKFNRYEPHLENSRAIISDPTFRYSKAFINSPLVKSIARISIPRDMGSTARIKVRENNDLPSTGERLPSMYGRVRLRYANGTTSFALIRNDLYDDFSNEATVTRRDMVSIAQLVASDPKTSRATIRQLKPEDMNSLISITGSRIACKVFIRATSRMLSEASLAGRLASQLPNVATISRPDMKSKVQLRIHSNMGSRVFIRGFVNDNLTSEVDIRGSLLDLMESTAALRVSNLNDMTSMATINNISDLFATATILRNENDDKQSEAKVRHTDELIAPSFVNLFLEDSIHSVALFGRPNMYSVANIIRSVELPSIARIRLTDGQLFSNMATISRNFIYSEARLRLMHDTHSFARIRSGNARIDFGNVANIKSEQNSDFYGTSNIKYRGNGEFSSIAGLYVYNEFANEARIRRSVDKDLQGKIQVYEHTNMGSIAQLFEFKQYLSQAIIRRSAESDLQTLLTIRQMEVDELDSYIFINGGFWISEMVSRAAISWIDRMDMAFRAEIISGARKWIPNVHAPEVFNYKNRKLPRQWNRQDFISD